jgi:ABC-type spermidine/putrescine transport system permease subunit II
MTESRLARVLLRVASGGVLAFLYLPLLVIVLYAFNPSRIQAWPPSTRCWRAPSRRSRRWCSGR